MNTEMKPNSSQSSETQFVDIHELCRLIGGNRPVSPATAYRGVKSGLFPKPVKVGPNCSRWVRSEVMAALSAQIAKRDAEVEAA